MEVKAVLVRQYPRYFDNGWKKPYRVIFLDSNAVYAVDATEYEWETQELEENVSQSEIDVIIFHTKPLRSSHKDYDDLLEQAASIYSEDFPDERFQLKPYTSVKAWQRDSQR